MDRCAYSAKYLEWFSSQFFEKKEEEWCSFAVPFFNESRDNFTFLIHRREDGYIEISDDGAGISRIEDYSPGFFLPDSRKELLQSILSRYAIDFIDGNELSLVTSEEDFPSRMHDLIQAALEISSLRPISTGIMRHLFKERFYNFIMQNKISLAAGPKITGKSQITHSFDFSYTIPSGRRLLNLVPFPDRKSIQSLIFSWNDTAESRGTDTTLFAIIDDTKKDLHSKHRDALLHYSVHPFPWSNRSNLEKTLRKVSGA